MANEKAPCGPFDFYMVIFCDVHLRLLKMQQLPMSDTVVVSPFLIAYHTKQSTSPPTFFCDVHLGEVNNWYCGPMPGSCITFPHSLRTKQVCSPLLHFPAMHC